MEISKLENSEILEKIEGKKLNYDCIFHIISFLEDKDKFRLFSLDKTINQNKKKVVLTDWYTYKEYISQKELFNFAAICDVHNLEDLYNLPDNLLSLNIGSRLESTFDIRKYTKLNLLMTQNSKAIINLENLPKSVTCMVIFSYIGKLSDFTNLKKLTLINYSEREQCNWANLTKLTHLTLTPLFRLPRNGIILPKSLTYLEMGCISYENFEKTKLPDLIIFGEP